VLIAYVDESGNLGDSLTYTLGCVLVNPDVWPETFNDVISFRRFLRARFGVPVRAELKANYLIRNEGPFKALALPDGQRRIIYRQAMRLHAKLGLRTFAVVIRKQELTQHDPALNARDVAWDFMLQRLRNQTEKPPLAPNTVLLIHDEGEQATIRKLARRARRAGTVGSMFGTGMLKVPFSKLIDDPVPRDSRHSYFIQLADLAAYAAWRRLYAPGAKVAQIVPQGMWDELGAARFDPVTNEKNPPGVVHWPPK
jgi:Protein of unknown function (DUF3800)